MSFLQLRSPRFNNVLDNPPSSVVNASVSQVAATLTFSGGTQAVVTTQLGSVAQVAATLTFNGGTQSTKVAVTQSAATLTFTGGTQSFVAKVDTSVTQVAATLNFTGGTQVVKVTNTYYVKVSGNDTLDGRSPANAWATITHVNAQTFNPGDTILFNGGDTFTGKIYMPYGGTSGSPITFSSYGTGNGIISNTSDNGFYIYDTGYVTVQNLNFTGGTTAMANGSSGIGVFADTSSQYSGITITGVDATQFTYGLSIGASSTGGFSSPSITSSNFHGNTTDGLVTYGPTYTPATPNYAHSNITVTSVIAHDNLGDSGNTTAATGNGIVLGSVNTATISLSTAYNNGANNAYTGAGPVGIWTYDSTAVTISQCLSYNNKTGTVADGDGFDLDINTSNSTIEYCLSYGNWGAGILVFGASNVYNTGNVVRYNITWGNGQNTHGTPYGEFALAGTYQNNSVYNNTFVAQNGPSNPYCVWFDGTANAGNVFRNNILYGATSPTTNTSSAWSTTDVLMQGNNYYNAAGSTIKWGATSYTSLATWRAAVSGQEVVSAVNTGLLTNPALVNASSSPTVTDPTVLTGADGFFPLNTSGDVGTGLDLNADFGTIIGSQDYFGNSLSAPYNIGAVQGATVAITQSAAVITFSGGTQAVATVRDVSITQVAAVVTFTGGTQVVAAVQKVAVTQTAAILTFSGGTQFTGGVSNGAVAQTAASLTFTGGTQIVAFVFSSSLAQIAALLTFTPGTQRVVSQVFVSWVSPSIIVNSGGNSSTVNSGENIENILSGVKIDSVTSGTKNETVTSGDKSTIVIGSETKVNL